ncbi:RsbRD N-terminal domain-containing protein [Desulfothermus naphthae]
MSQVKNEVFDRLKSKRDEIIERWVGYALSTYPKRARHFFSHQKDPFLNPVGNILKNELCEIYNQLLLDKAQDSIREHVDAIVRVRAVQDFSPSSAVMIFWGLKDIVKEVLEIEDFDGSKWSEVDRFFRRIDQLCLLAFDIFMSCREKLWELKTKEVHANIRNILRHYEVNKGKNLDK